MNLDQHSEAEKCEKFQLCTHLMSICAGHHVTCQALLCHLRPEKKVLCALGGKLDDVT